MLNVNDDGEEEDILSWCDLSELIIRLRFKFPWETRTDKAFWNGEGTGKNR